MSPLCNGYARKCAAICLTALTITALLSTQQVGAAKLTSLGSTFENLGNKNVDVVNNRGESTTAEDVDYSSMACSAPEDGGSSMATCSSSYGVDNSFPIHHAKYAAAEASKEGFYKDFMDGCREMYHPEGYTCDVSEKERMEMNLRQPKSMFVSVLRAPFGYCSSESLFTTQNTNLHVYPLQNTCIELHNTWLPQRTCSSLDDKSPF